MGCSCILKVIGVILVGLGIKYFFIDIEKKEKLETKHKKLEKFKLEREIKDLDIEIKLQKILINKKIKESVGEDINDLKIDYVYNKLKENQKLKNILKEIEKLEKMKNEKSYLENKKKIFEI